MRLAATFLTALGIAAAAPGGAAAQDAAAGGAGIVSEYVLPHWPRPGERLVLSSSGDEKRLLLRSAPSAASVPALPMLADLREQARPTPFGAEERCTATRTGDAIAVSCAPGTRPAGILLRFDGRVPRAAAVEALLRTSGGEGYSAQFVRPGEDAEAAVPVDGEQRLTLPQGSEEPAQLVLLAPRQGGSLRIERLELAPVTAARSHPTGGWAWQPSLWLGGGEPLIRAAAARQMERLYISLVIEGGQVRQRRELMRFVRAAREAGIVIEAVEGDPRMVADGLADAISRARAIRRYQEEAPREARLAGVQYDIEPYVLPGWGTAPLDHRAWSAAVRALAEASGAPLHLVLPFWIANEEAGARFLADIEPSVAAVTVMGYRTDPALLTIISEPLLHWGAMNGKPVRLAMEAGPVAAETEEAFVPASAGRLAVVERGGAVTALLLAADGVVPGARMYASEGAVTIRPERVSFLGDEARMTTTAHTLTPAFSAWSSFAGIDYHGIAWPAGASTRVSSDTAPD